MFTTFYHILQPCFLCIPALLGWCCGSGGVDSAGAGVAAGVAEAAAAGGGGTGQEAIVGAALALVIALIPQNEISHPNGSQCTQCTAGMGCWDTTTPSKGSLFSYLEWRSSESKCLVFLREIKTTAYIYIYAPVTYKTLPSWLF